MRFFAMRSDIKGRAMNNNQTLHLFRIGARLFLISREEAARVAAARRNAAECYLMKRAARPRNLSLNL